MEILKNLSLGVFLSKCLIISRNDCLSSARLSYDSLRPRSVILAKSESGIYMKRSCTSWIYSRRNPRKFGKLASFLFTICKTGHVVLILSSFRILDFLSRLTIVLRLALSLSLQWIAYGRCKPTISSRLASEKSWNPLFPM